MPLYVLCFMFSVCDVPGYRCPKLLVPKDNAVLAHALDDG